MSGSYSEEYSEVSSFASSSLFSSGSVAKSDSSFCSKDDASTGTGLGCGVFFSEEFATVSVFSSGKLFDSSTSFEAPSSKTESSLLTTFSEFDFRSASPVFSTAAQWHPIVISHLALTLEITS